MSNYEGHVLPLPILPAVLAQPITQLAAQFSGPLGPRDFALSTPKELAELMAGLARETFLAPAAPKIYGLRTRPPL